MSEEDLTVVQEAVADAQQEGSSQEHSTTERAYEESPKDRNWREMRQVVEELKRRNEALEARLSAPQEQQEEYVDDDLATVAITRKLFKKETEDLKRELKRLEAETVEDRIRLKYADYDQVVNKDNLEKMFAQDPELVKMLQKNQDNPYEQAIAAYKLMKRYGSTAEESAKLKENQSKPRTAGSIGSSSALSQANAFANGLTPQLRQQLWNEMKEASKGA